MSVKYLSKSEESNLVDSVKTGDEKAWTQLYESFILPLRGYVAGRIGSVEDAQDLSHECFIRAQIGLIEGRYDKQYRFYTFLHGIADHLIQDYWRSRSRNGIGFAEGVARNGGHHQETHVPNRSLERLDLLHLVLSCPAKPHQILMFCFVKLLEWRPREIVSERGQEVLKALSTEFLDIYFDALSSFVSHKTFYNDICSPLVESMTMPAAIVYKEHEYQTIESIIDSTVGGLRLDRFWGDNPSASISDWCDRVKIRTRKMILTSNIEVNGNER